MVVLWAMCSDGGPFNSFFTGDGSSGSPRGPGASHNDKASAACEIVFFGSGLGDGDGEGVSVRLKD